MGLYDNYQLANSTATPAYVGSALQEKIGVLSTLQQRADQSQYNDDMLARTVQDALINEQDRPLYERVVSKYRDNINARAKAGNYEDMQMSTARDAYNYASDFKAFGRNFGLTQQRIADIKKMSERGADGKAGIGSETADALMREMSSYSGLKKNKDGNYTNFYQGAAIAPDVDVASKVKSWAGDIVARETGQEVRSMQEGADGQMHYVTVGGKTGVVTAKQIKDAINYGSQSDQGFKDYLHQKQRLETNGLDKITYDDMAANPQAKSTADAIQAEANRQGVTFGQIYRQMKAEGIKNDVASNAYNYGMKYVKNDVERKLLDDGLTEGAKKKLDTEDNNFAVPITLGAYGSAFDTPNKLQEEITASQGRATMATQNMNQWLKTSGIRQVGSKFIDPNGVDVTDQAMRQQLMVQQEKSHQATIAGIDAAARKQTGFNPGPEDIKRAQAVSKKAYESVVNDRANNQLTPEGVKEIAKNTAAQTYKEALKHVRGYDAYAKAVADKSQALTLTTSAMRFTKKEDNEKLESAVNNLTTGDFESNLLGLKHIGTQKNGEQLTPDEYNSIKGKIQFAGQVMGADGIQHSVFKAEDPKHKGQDVIFSMDGIQTTKSMPKLMGIDAQQLYTQQMIRSATNNPSKSTSIPLSGGVQLNLRVLGPDEAGQFGNGKYKISITGKDGKGGAEQNIDSENELLQKVSSIFNAHGN